MKTNSVKILMKLLFLSLKRADNKESKLKYLIKTEIQLNQAKKELKCMISKEKRFLRISFSIKMEILFLLIAQNPNLILKEIQ